MTFNFCTLFDVNYLTRGLALYKSILKNCPDFTLWVLCMDISTYQILTALHLKNIIPISLFDFEDSRLLAAKKTRSFGEYCWTCTPSLLLYVFRHFPQADTLTYLDSDLFFYSSPAPLYQEIGANSILLIPHRIVPWKKYVEKKSGKYNVSLLIFRRDKTGLSSLRWWRSRCLEWCYDRYETNRYGDQKYLEEFPRLFKKVCSSKNVGAGVASWNLPLAKIQEKTGNIFVSGQPLIFFHFQSLKLYPPRGLLSKIPRGTYFDQTIYRHLLYEKYVDQLYNNYAFLKDKFSSFSSGFLPRPPWNIYLPELILDFLSRVKSFIRVKLFHLDYLSYDHN